MENIKHNLDKRALEKEALKVVGEAIEGFVEIIKDDTKHNISSATRVVDGILIRVDVFNVD